MKKLLYFTIFLSLFNVNAQQKVNLTGKTFSYTDPRTLGVEKYSFLSNSKATLLMISSYNGQTFRDVGNCQSSVEGNRVKINCICEDRDTFPDPLKEIFIYDAKTGNLSTTVHFDQNRRPRVFEETN